MFALKLTLRPWKLQPLSQFLTLITLSTLLILAGFFGSLALSLPELRHRLEGDHIASVFLDPALEGNSLTTIRDQIQISLGSRAVAVEFVDSDAFLNSIRETQSDLVKEVDALGSEKEWVTPKFFSLHGTLSAKIIETLRAIPGVEAVTFSEKRFKPILENIAAIEWLSRVLFAAILLAMVAILTLLGRINSSIFHDAEIIISQMGGSSSQARFPARFSPVILSGSAGVIATLVLLKLNPWFAIKMATLSPFLKGMEAASLTTSTAVFGLGIATGILAFLFSPREGIQTR